jgi:hypothetical protein
MGPTRTIVLLVLMTIGMVLNVLARGKKPDRRRSDRAPRPRRDSHLPPSSRHATSSRIAGHAASQQQTWS